MRTFLGVFVVLMVVSGETHIHITGFLNEDVLLPCSCENVNLSNEIKWQKQTPHPEVVCSNKINATNYTGRIENSSNCSILLKNITEKDNGKYKCVFYNPNYNYTFVTLHVNVSSDSTTKISWALSDDQVNATDPTNPITSVIVVLVLLGLGILALYIWRRHRNNKLQGIPSREDSESANQDKMMEDV